VVLGDQIETGETEISAAMVDAFATLTGDQFSIHMSETAARDYGFHGRVAHGLLVLSVVDGLKNQADAQFDAVASLGWDWSFRRPVLAGDRVRAMITVLDKRQTRAQGRGILQLGVAVTNQRNDIVQEGTNLLMVRRLSGPGSPENR